MSRLRWRWKVLLHWMWDLNRNSEGLIKSLSFLPVSIIEEKWHRCTNISLRVYITMSHACLICWWLHAFHSHLFYGNFKLLYLKFISHIQLLVCRHFQKRVLEKVFILMHEIISRVCFQNHSELNWTIDNNLAVILRMQCHEWIVIEMLFV